MNIALTPLQRIVLQYDDRVRERIGGQDIHRAAVWGQSKQEANENPAAEERPGSDTFGIGLIQWSFSRHTQLVDFAYKRNKSWQDLETQVDFICFELGPPDPMVPGSGAYHSKWLLIQRTTTLQAATETVMAYYEAPAGWQQEIKKYRSTTANMPRRLAGAQEAFDAIQMLHKPATALPKPQEKPMAEVPATTEPSNAEILAELRALRQQVETVGEQAAVKFGVPIMAVQLVEHVIINPLLDRMDPQIAAKIDGNATAEAIVHVLGMAANWGAQFLSGKLALPAPQGQ